MLSFLRTGMIAVLLSCGISAQIPMSPAEIIRDPLPDPGCNQYTLQTVPKDGFGWRQRTCFWRGQLFTGSALFGAAFFAGIAQATDSPTEWPQGVNGYGRRFGTRYAQGMVKSSVDFLIGGLVG